MRPTNSRQSPSVVNGRVRKKNNWELTPNYYSHQQRELVIDRKRPGEGYRHVLMQRDVERFIKILPDWEEMSRDLNAIVLAPGDSSIWGYHTTGVVHLCAWPEDWEMFYTWPDFKRESYIFDKIGVPWRSIGEEGADVLFTQNTARAFMLLDVLLHEIGHHHDAINNRSRTVVRGEAYANTYARKYGDLVWERFTKHFPLD